MPPRVDRAQLVPHHRNGRAVIQPQRTGAGSGLDMGAGCQNVKNTVQRGFQLRRNHTRRNQSWWGLCHHVNTSPM